MKTNIFNTMKQYTNVICAVVLMLGMSVSARGAVTGTIEFGNNGTKIESASVTGDDDQGNTWTITTVGTSSYTPNTNYTQVGSSAKPATSITFEMTLPASKTITAFSAKFGGFSDTAGTITLKVGDTSVGSGSLNGTNDVTISNSSTASGTVLQVTVTSISKGVKCYYISYTCSNSERYMVTYNAEGGTCGTPSEQEAALDGGVILPAATANAASFGWGFYGWAASAESSITTTAPTIVGKAGDRYYPASSITLHAVYAKGEYTKVTSTSELTVNSGEKYLIMGYDDDSSDEDYGMFVMTHESYIDGSDNEYMKGVKLGVAPADTYSAAEVNANWRYELEKSDTYYYFKNIATSKYVDTDNSAKRIYTSTKTAVDKYIITYASNGYCTIVNNSTYFSYPYLNVFDGGDFSNGNSAWEKMMIYKETITPKYCSDPSTVKLVASPAAGGSVVFDDNSSEEMDFGTADGYIGDITAAPNSGYDFVNWVSSISGSEIEIDPTNGAEAAISAETSATITAYFYQNHSVTYNLTEGGVVGEGGNPTTITKSEMNGFSSGFTMQAHYKNMTLTSVTMGGSPLIEGEEADYEWELDDDFAMLTIHHDNIDGDIVITVSATHMEYTKYAFSCADLTLTPHLVTDGTPIFITSTAEKKVRSQDYIEITGNGLTPNTALTFPGLDSKFEVLTSTGETISTDASGEISVNAYIFYTPAADATTDGLDQMAGLTVSVGGAKPKQASMIQSIIGRHIATDFVIAAKNTTTNKWYALPADMTGTGNPTPVEIAVNDINNPSLAYTASGNIYNLYLSADKEKVQLGMKNNVNDGGKSFALWANNSASSTDIGKNSGLAESSLGDNYKWTLAQTATNIDNAQDAKYTISNQNNANALKAWFAASGGPKWGLYSSGEATLRLIPASNIPFTEASVVEWGQHTAIIEVDATNPSINATSVVAHLGEATSAAITLVQTKANDAKNKTSKYNYTVNFGDGIDFAAAASNGAMMTLEWKNGEAVKAMSNIVVPKIIATSATMSSLMEGDAQWETEVHVLPNVTLEANGNFFSNSDVMIKQLEIYPGATVNVTSGTLKVKTLALRNGWTRVSGKNYDVARLYVATDANLVQNALTDVWYSDWYIDYDQYYPIAIPFPVATSSIIYKNSNSSAIAGVKLRYYSGELRATNIQQNQDANWVEYNWNGTDPAVPTNLEPSHGYIMTAKRPSGKAFSIVRMPLTFSNAWTTAGEQGSVIEEMVTKHKDQVTVMAWGNESVPWYAKGWNIIANPYMALHQGELTYDDASGDVIQYANIPDIDFKEYNQLPIETTKLKPSSAFLVQAPKTGTVTFGATNRQASAPSYRREVQAEALPAQKAYIVLASDESEDMMGILVSDKYSADYEINADLEKLLGDGSCLRTYMHFNEMKMAYLAINPELAEQLIPVSVRIETEGEHTFSMHNASKVSELKGVYLTDFQTGDVTNLMEDSYSFSSKAGTISGRFAINAKIGERPVPTDLDIVGGDTNGSEPVKFLYRDKVYILYNGVIYDSTGKKIK